MEPQDKATKSPEEKPSFWEKPFIKSSLEGMGQTMGQGIGLLILPSIALVSIVVLIVMPITSGITDIGTVASGPVGGVLLGGTAAAALALVTETPVAVAVVAGFFVWWLWNTLL
jgi:hypothetical protein